VSFDPFRPDDAGDHSAVYEAKRPKTRRHPVMMRALVALGALALVAAAALVAVAVA
jgi:hypothetical protein